MNRKWILSMLLTAAAMPAALGQPAPAARAKVASVVTHASYLGIGAQDIDSARANTLKLKEVRGAEVTSVQPDSPAAKAGIKEGDVILEYNGQPVEGKDQLARMVQETPAGRQVRIGISRNGTAQTVTATTEAGGPRVFISGDGAWAMPKMPEMPKMPSIEIPQFQMLMRNPMLGIM